MTASRARTDRSEQAVQAWLALYTRGLPASIAEERRAEVESDLWDEAAMARVVGYPDRLPAQRLSRLVRGIPSDIAWRFDHRSASVQGRETMRPTPTQWLLLGVSTIVFALALWGGAMAVLNPDPTRWEGWGAYGAAAAGAVGLAGVAALIRWPVAGLGLVLIAAILGALAMPWLWPIAIVPAAAALWRWRTRHGLVAAGQP